MLDAPSRTDFILKLIERTGFPAAVCFCLLYGLWIFGDRTTSAHLATLKVMQESVAKQSAAMEIISITLAENLSAGQERTRLLETIISEQKKTTEAIRGQ